MVVCLLPEAAYLERYRLWMVLSSVWVEVTTWSKDGMIVELVWDYMKNLVSLLRLCLLSEEEREIESSLHASAST